jgi:hypothetical protein
MFSLKLNSKENATIIIDAINQIGKPASIKIVGHLKALKLDFVTSL